jgi:hypothetical protein
MTDPENFSKEISDFRSGILDYSYSFNSVGNLVFKDGAKKFNESFFKVPVKNFEYNQKNIKELYNLDFEEFKSVKGEAKSAPESVDVSSYKKQIVDLKAAISSSSNSTDEYFRLKSELKAHRDTIIKLRINAGEGNTDEDFSGEFPFYPKNQSNISKK